MVCFFTFNSIIHSMNPTVFLRQPFLMHSLGEGEVALHGQSEPGIHFMDT